MKGFSYLSLFLYEIVHGPSGDVSHRFSPLLSLYYYARRPRFSSHLGQRPNANAQNLMISCATRAATGSSISISFQSNCPFLPCGIDPFQSTTSNQPMFPRSVPPCSIVRFEPRGPNMAVDVSLRGCTWTHCKEDDVASILCHPLDRVRAKVRGEGAENKFPSVGMHQ